MACWNKISIAAHAPNYPIFVGLANGQSKSRDCITCRADITILRFADSSMQMSMPLYAYYSGSNGHHLVVVTGVDYSNGLVFVNNPQGYSGAQTYDEFLSGYLGQSPSNDSTFDYLIYPD